MGADTDQLRAILKVRLMMDDRRPLNLGRQNAQKKSKKNNILLSIFLSVLTGAMYILPLVSFTDVALGFTGYYLLFLFFLTINLITDFSNVLTDTRDKSIVLQCPVDGQTLFLSRTLHIFIYLFRVVFPMSIPGWIAVSLMHGWVAALVFPVTILLIIFTALFFVMSAYMLVLQLAPTGRFKDVIGYFQIVASVFVFALVYLGPRAMAAEEMVKMTINNFQWLRFMPPYWIANIYCWIFNAPIAKASYIFAGLAFVFPLVCLWLTLKFLAPKFVEKLGGIDASDAPPVSANSKKTSSATKKNIIRLAEKVNKTEAAQAGFILTWLQSGRSRAYKMKIYPMFAYVPIYFLYIIFQSRKPLAETFEHLHTKPYFLMLLYMCSFVMVQALMYISISEQYKASWVFYAKPVSVPGEVMGGMFKAVWIKYFLPFFACISALVLSIWGMKITIDIILALLNITLFTLIMSRVSVRAFPFSRIEQMNNKTGTNILRGMASMLLPFSMGFVHYAALSFWWLKLMLMLLSIAAIWLLWDSYAKTSWAVIKETDVI
jgi:hypothetical protein